MTSLQKSVAGLIGIAIVLLAGPFVRSGPLGIDQAWHDLLAGNRSPAATAVSLVLDIVGGTLSMTVVTLVLVIALFLAARREEAVTIGMTVALGAVLYSIIKAVVDRQRPADGIVAAGSHSFPSGHSATAAALTVAIALAFPVVWTWVLAGVWMLLMAFSRTYLLVHWLTDVASGLLLGASVALLVSVTVRTITGTRRLPRTRG